MSLLPTCITINAARLRYLCQVQSPLYGKELYLERARKIWGKKTSLFYPRQQGQFPASTSPLRKISHKLRMKINKMLLCHNKRSCLSKQSKDNLPAVSSAGHADVWTDWVLTPHVSLYLLCMDLLLLIQPKQNSKEELQSIALYSHQLIWLQLCTSQRLCQVKPLVH